MFGPSQGEQIAHLRRRLGFTQGELATTLGRSESWVSQVERGIIPIERVSMLRRVADALQVSVDELQPDLAAPEPTRLAGTDLGSVRLALTGDPALIVTFTKAGGAASIDVPALGVDVDSAWSHVHASQLADAAPLLASLIPALEVATSVGNDAALPLLASTYQATAAAFAAQDEPDAAWLAADRAVATARRMHDPLQVVAGLFRMVHVFIRLRRPEQADRVVEDATAVLQPIVEGSNASPAAISALGAITLAGAVSKAREGERTAARAALDRARALARKLSEDRNELGTEFGPTNVDLHAIAIAADLGDAGEALDIAAKVDPSHLSAERQARFHIDVARAHAQRRHIGEATAALMEAERIAPEQTRGHHLARETIDDLLRLAGRRPSADLVELAERVGVAPLA